VKPTRYFVDIDQTLTKGKEPRPGTINRLKELIASGAWVAVWSGGGERYVRRFCARNGSEPTMYLPKPTVLVDDNPEVFEARLCRRITPGQFARGAR